MKKNLLKRCFASMLMLLAMTTTFAQNVARIGSTEYESLAAALSASQAGDVIEITVAGNYTLPTVPRVVTIRGAVDGVQFVHHGGNQSVASVASGSTFKNVTFDFGNENYHGFQGSAPGVNDPLYMEDCTFNGKFFSYKTMTFTNCQFHQTNGDYCMWLYGGPATVTFNGCTFTNDVTGKFLHMYSESSINTVKCVVKDCHFINNGTESKAAINVKATSGSTDLTYEVEVENSDVQGEFPAVGEKNNGDNTNVLSSLVQVDDRKSNENTAEQITVAIDDDPVYSAGTEPEVIEISTLEQFVQFRDNVNSGNTYAGQVVKLTSDLDLSSIANWTPIGNLTSYPTESFDGTFNGGGHTISNVTINDNTTNYAVAALFGSIVNGTIHDLTVSNINIQSTHYAGGIVAYTSNAPTIKNCHVVDATISSTPELIGGVYDNGDKVGGIIGYCTSGTKVINCTVENSTLSAYRDLGGIAGYAAGSVTDCSVEDVTIQQDNTNAYKDYVITTYGEITGRTAGTTVQENNTTTEVTLEVVNMSAEVTIGADGMATYCAPFDVVFPSDVKAYVALSTDELTNSVIRMTPVAEAKAGEGVLLMAEAGTYTLSAANAAVAQVDGNLLKGVTTATTVQQTEGSYTNFYLTNTGDGGATGVAFYLVPEGGKQIPAGKAYLQLTTSDAQTVPEYNANGAKVLTLVFEGEITGISTVNVKTTSVDAVYDMQGRRVQNPTRGLYIINGKKVVIK